MNKAFETPPVLPRRHMRTQTRRRNDLVEIWKKAEGDLGVPFEAECCFTFDYRPYDKGDRDTPPYEAAMTLLSVTTTDGDEIQVSQTDIDEATAMAWKQVEHDE